MEFYFQGGYCFVFASAKTIGHVMLIFLIMSCTFALKVEVNPSAFKSFTFFSSHPKFPRHVSPFYHPQMFRACVLHVPASAVHNFLCHSAHVNSAPSGHGSPYAKLSNVSKHDELITLTIPMVSSMMCPNYISEYMSTYAVPSVLSPKPLTN